MKCDVPPEADGYRECGLKYSELCKDMEGCKYYEQYHRLNDKKKGGLIEYLRRKFS